MKQFQAGGAAISSGRLLQSTNAAGKKIKISVSLPCRRVSDDLGLIQPGSSAEGKGEGWGRRRGGGGEVEGGGGGGGSSFPTVVIDEPSRWIAPFFAGPGYHVPLFFLWGHALIHHTL